MAALGCWVRISPQQRCERPAEIAHRNGAGWALKSSNYHVIPLCPEHHRCGRFGECLDNGTKTFEAKYGTQDTMIAEVQAELGYYGPYMAEEA